MSRKQLASKNIFSSWNLLSNRYNINLSDNVSDIFQYSEKLQRQRRYKPFYISSNKDVVLVFSGDYHVGNARADIKSIFNDIKYALSLENKDTDVRFCFMGDLMENAATHAPGDFNDVILRNDEQKDFVFNLLLPIWKLGKAAAFLSGNHGLRWQREGILTDKELFLQLLDATIEYAEMIGKKIPFPDYSLKGYGGEKFLLPPPYAADLICDVGKHTYNVFIHHGFGCFDSETEILTQSGWKKYYDIALDDIALTLNLNTNLIEPSKINDIFIYDYDGPMVKLETETCDLLVTENHNMLFKSKYEYVKDIPFYQKCFAKDLPKYAYLPSFGNISTPDCPITFHTINSIGSMYYTGKVWCISTDNQTVVSRRNGKITITGNSGREIGSKINNITKVARGKEGYDIIALAHSHLKAVVKKAVENINEAAWREIWLVNTGGYLLFENSYAEKYAMDPTAIGCVMLKLKAGKHKLVVPIEKDY